MVNKKTGEVIDLDTPRLGEALNKVGDMFKAPLESLHLKFDGFDFVDENESHITYSFGFKNWVIMGSATGGVKGKTERT